MKGTEMDLDAIAKTVADARAAACAVDSPLQRADLLLRVAEAEMQVLDLQNKATTKK